MNRKIILIRHGQTLFNAQHRLQGHCNSPLTVLGRQQAEKIGETLKKTLNTPSIWQVYSSPLGRAIETAEIVCNLLGITPDSIIQDSRLQEVNLGEWEKKVITDLQQQHPRLCEAPDWYIHAPGGEYFDSVCKRLQSWLDDTTVSDNIIVVAHGLSGLILRGLYARMDYAEIWNQKIPQDAYYVLADNGITRVDCSS